MGIPEAGKQGPFTQNLPGRTLMRPGKIISDIQNPSMVFDKVSVNMIFPIT